MRTKAKTTKRPRIYYECRCCGHDIYVSKTYGLRCGPGCDKAEKGKVVR